MRRTDLKWYMTTPTAFLKLFTIILGVVVIGVGCHAYLESLWTDVYEILSPLRPYLQLSGTTLPDIAMERLFVGVVITFTTVSALYLLAYSIDDEIVYVRTNRIMDTVYHVIGGTLFAISGLLIIYSAYAIEAFIEESSREQYYLPGAVVMPATKMQLFGEKFAAGVLSIINGLLYWIVATLVITRGKMNCFENFV